jgi:hypothetical protein
MVSQVIINTWHASIEIREKLNMNSAAHILAREAVKYVIDRIWVEEILNCIYGIVIGEHFSHVLLLSYIYKSRITLKSTLILRHMA